MNSISNLHNVDKTLAWLFSVRMIQRCFLYGPWDCERRSCFALRFTLSYGWMGSLKKISRRVTEEGFHHACARRKKCASETQTDDECEHKKCPVYIKTIRSSVLHIITNPTFQLAFKLSLRVLGTDVWRNMGLIKYEKCHGCNLPLKHVTLKWRNEWILASNYSLSCSSETLNSDYLFLFDANFSFSQAAKKACAENLLNSISSYHI